MSCAHSSDASGAGREGGSTLSNRDAYKALQMANIGVWSWTPATDRIDWSPCVAELWGFDPDTAPEQLEAVAARIHPDDRPAWRTNLAACLAGTTGHNIEFRICRADGSVRWVHALGDAERDDRGHVRRLIGTIRDITCHVEAHQASEHIFDLPLHLLLITDRTGLIQRANPAWQEHLGHDPHHLIGVHHETLIHPDDRALTREQTERLLTDTRIVHFENRHRHRDGSYHRLLWSVTREPDSGYLYGAAADVTTQHAYAEALKARENSLQEAERIGGLGHWELDLERNQLHWSEGLFRLFERDAEGAPSSYEAFLECVHPDDRAPLDEAYQSALHGDIPYRVEHRAIMPDGRVKWLYERAEVHRASTGEPRRVIGTTQEITAVKAAELEQTRLQRLYRTLTEVQDASIRANDRTELFRNVCHVVQAAGDFAAAWVDQRTASATWERLITLGEVERLPAAFRNPDAAVNHLAEANATRVRCHLRRSQPTDPGEDLGVAACLGLGNPAAPEAVLSVAAPDLGPFSTDSVQLLERIAETVSFALGNLARAEALRTSERKYRLLVENQTDLVIKLDDSGCFEFASPSYCRTFGQTEASLIGQPWLPFVHPEDRAATRATLNALKDPPHTAYMEQRADTLAGRRWIEWWNKALLDSSGELVSIVGVGRDITERKQAEAALAENELRYRELINNMSDGVAVYQPVDSGQDFVFRELNRAGLTQAGFAQRADVIGQRVRRLFPGIEAIGLFAVLQRVCRTGQPEHLPAAHYTDDRLDVWVDNYVFRLPSGDLVTIYSDVTEKIQREKELQIAAAAFEAQQGILITDGCGRIQRVNRALAQLTGYTSNEVRTVRPRFLLASRSNRLSFRELWHSIRQDGRWEGELIIRHKEGRTFPAWTAVSPVRTGSGAISHFVAHVVDISDRKEAQARIHELAFYDTLTGLANRRLFRERLAHALRRDGRTGQIGAVILVDIDHFKHLNDMYGHETGDALLVAVAQRLGASVRTTDTVARPGGDEFLILLESLGTGWEEATRWAASMARTLIGVFDRSFALEPLGDFRGSCSLGITFYQDSGLSVDDLVKQAEVALYEAKRSGRNRWRFFDPSMQLAVEKRATVELALRKAMPRQELQLHYQPQVFADGTIYGVEALLRWYPHQGGPIPPGDFIPIAEESGLILPIGRWVLQTACQALAEWQDQLGIEGLRVAVNVSATQFLQTDFNDELRQVIAHTGANPRGLCLELTESVFLQDLDAVVARIHPLKKLGIGISLDDFGTGYSSLAYLRHLPLDTIKIDTSFVRDIPHSAPDTAIVRTILSMGQALGIGIVAEGVETEAQRAFLEAERCQGFQGYLFGRPMPAEAVLTWLTKNAPPTP